MNRHALRIVLLALAVGTMLLTRLPHTEPLWTVASLGLGAAALGLGAAWSLRKRPWMRVAALAGGAALLLVPTAPGAALAVPAPLVAILALLAAYSLHDLDAGRAPALPTEGQARGRRTTGLLPLLLVVGVVGAMTLLLRLLLPDRVGSLYELRAALGPLVGLAVVAALLLGLVWLRDGLAGEPRQTEEADA